MAVSLMTGHQRLTLDRASPGKGSSATASLGISIGGDSDTIACIAGGISQAYYGGVPEAICRRVYEVLDEHLGGITKRFMMTYCPEAPERPSVQVKAGSIPV